MHETVIASSLLKIIEEEVAAHAQDKMLVVTRISLNIGLLSAIEPHTLQGCFELLAEGTVAEGAALEISVLPLRGVCADCARAVSVTSRRDFQCPACGGSRVDWRGGNEMDITALQVRERNF